MGHADPVSTPGQGANLQGRTAIVTGGASGIGRATALLLAQHGAQVFVGDFRPLAENAEPFARLGIVQTHRERGREAQQAVAKVTLVHRILIVLPVRRLRSYSEPRRRRPSLGEC